MAEAEVSSVDVEAQQLQRAVSPHFRRPLLHLLNDPQERRDKYLKICVPLHKAAMKGDWKAAKCILEKDLTLLCAAITLRWATLLHVAAGANSVHFVEELVKIMDSQDLELQDVNGNTAFCFAAATGNLHMVKIMETKNKNLPTIRGGARITPLHMAALQGKSEMAWHLYSKTIQDFEQTDWIILLFYCVNSGIYDLAMQLLKKKPDLAFKKDEANETILHILARKPLGLKQTQQRQLVQFLWSIFLTQDDKEILDNIRVPSHVTFNAVEVGNFEFLDVLISTYPELIWEADERNRSIIHIAILQRHADIFKLLQDIGPIKEFIASYLDNKDQSNLLHMAAKLPPLDQLNLVSGAAFQMTLELSWFEEVKKILPPSFMDMKNAEGLTPKQLFIKEHQELLSKAESWMKGVANSCMVVSTLIAIGVYYTSFNTPGGLIDNTGIPNYLQKRSFLVFGTSNAIALISSSTSTLIFLSILISRYAVQDFHKSLLFKLISGLVALFMSIISMMVAFGSGFFTAYNHGLNLVPGFISILLLVAVSLFAFSLFPIWYDIVYSTYFCKTLFRPCRHMFYLKK
ncbi:hypothetical protein QN277_019465 [Acacia crassicarpa]|uniref:PGG domain-containing protein n=1 Tax=Acacia crassicarpa TaxID=499986 RepID=A0AAE1JHJ6_9FABA|nr:hypothetical protein QN277_019465 [Acacia crassicarpa]